MVGRLRAGACHDGAARRRAPFALLEAKSISTARISLAARACQASWCWNVGLKPTPSPETTRKSGAQLAAKVGIFATVGWPSKYQTSEDKRARSRRYGQRSRAALKVLDRFVWRAFNHLIAKCRDVSDAISQAAQYRYDPQTGRQHPQARLSTGDAIFQAYTAASRAKARPLSHVGPLARHAQRPLAAQPNQQARTTRATSSAFRTAPSLQTETARLSQRAPPSRQSLAGHRSHSRAAATRP
jgi:hypothetical protein